MMIALDKAVRDLLRNVSTIGDEEIPVLKSLGRVLAEDVTSALSIPPFDKSAMDGYAVKAADTQGATAGAPSVLRVLEDIPAGSVGRHRLKRGMAARIMTGAPVPAGADAVVMVEDTERTEDGVQIMREVSRGHFIAKAGEDVRKGQKVLKAGTRIGPAQMGMIASTGRSRIRVARKPRLAVLSTGSEVMAPGSRLKAGQIFDSNGYSLTGQAMARGCDARFIGIAPDRKGALEKKLARTGGSDIVILSGGVSVGDYDLVQEVLLSGGIRRIFWNVAIKPGKPVFAGKLGERFVLGLPGNPVSCMVTFELFVRPLIDKMVGSRQVGGRRGRARLLEDVHLKPARRKFLRASLVQDGTTLGVQLFRAQQSGVLRSMLEADVLVDVADGVTELKQGTEVDVLYLE